VTDVDSALYGSRTKPVKLTAAPRKHFAIQFTQQTAKERTTMSQIPILHITITMLLAIPLALLIGTPATAETIGGKAWTRHSIDTSSQGADGVRVLDINGDRRPDIVTPWEEGGDIHICINPGPSEAKKPWPTIQVGRVATPEDAVLIDLDGDGATDVVSSTEGRDRSLYVHWAPSALEQYTDPDAWRTEPIPASQGMTRWMFCVPLQIDGKHGIDLAVASKAPNARVGYFTAPENPHDLAAWTYHHLWDASWVMTLTTADMDRDKDADLLISDRKNPACRGVLWFENPGAKNAHTTWKHHYLGARTHETMFLTLDQRKDNGRRTILTATRDNGIIVLEETEQTAQFHQRTIPLPDNTGTGKSVTTADLDQDGHKDIILSCENARDKHGVIWHTTNAQDQTQWRTISGFQGTKFDLIQACDLDEDGDPDLITCEEAENLGVIWYENPTRP